MPIEIVCKIKFAEEDAKPKEKEAGDEQSLLGAARGTAAPRDLATFASTSTLHGLGRACGPGPHGLRRTLWALALLTSLATFLYQAAGLAQGYLTRPHLVAMDPAAPAPVAGFPAVTLCNINRFRHSALSDADIFHLANLTGLPPKDRDGHRAAGLRYPEPDMVDILNRTGHQLADMLKSCNFSGHHCSASNFSVVSAASWPAGPGGGQELLGAGAVVCRGILNRASLPSFHHQRLALCLPSLVFPWASQPLSQGLTLLLLFLALWLLQHPRLGPGVWPGPQGPEAAQLAGKGCTMPRQDQVFSSPKKGDGKMVFWGPQQGRESGLPLGELAPPAGRRELSFVDTGDQCLFSISESHTHTPFHTLSHIPLSCCLSGFS